MLLNPKVQAAMRERAGAHQSHLGEQTKGVLPGRGRLFFGTAAVLGGAPMSMGMETADYFADFGGGAADDMFPPEIAAAAKQPRLAKEGKESFLGRMWDSAWMPGEKTDRVSL